MDAKGLQDYLIRWTVENSGHEDCTKRNRLGLSSMAGCDQEVYDQARNGRVMSEEEHLRTRLSFELQEAIVNRLRKMGIYGEPEEINLYGGTVMGHTDGTVHWRGETALLEIKTVAQTSHFPLPGRLPGKVYLQVQAYMHYLGYRSAVVIYLSRATGEVGVYHVRYSQSTGKNLEDKVVRLREAWESGHRPDCTCGVCRGNLPPQPPSLDGKGEQEVAKRAGRAFMEVRTDDKHY
jgi:hypothetical protein